MNLKSALIPLYAVATLFPRLLTLPGLPAQLQLTEVIFPVALWCFRRELIREVRRFPLFSVALAAYLITNLLSAVWAGNAGAMTEAGARIYLGVLSWLVLANGHCFGNDRLLNWWKWATVAVAGGCVLAYGWIVAGGSDPASLVTYVREYPYLGTVVRLRGTANVYGMMFMLLVPGFWLAYADWRAGRHTVWPAVVIALAAGLTFGKEMLLLPAGLLFYEASRLRNNWATVLRLAGFALVGLLLLGTHILLQRTGQELSEPGFTSGRTVLTVSGYHLDETNYTANKRSALLIGAAHPWLGVGPGRFQDYTEALVPQGNYPAHFGRFNPHSAWTGAFAETGLLGLLGLVALVAALWHSRPAELTPVAVMLLLFLVASIFKDVMNFRGLWVLIGLYLSDAPCRQIAER